MSDQEIQFPDVNYGKENKEKMQELTTSEWSPFFGKDYWEVFIFCMSYAYSSKLERKKVSGTGTMPPQAFRQETRHLMRALAIGEEGISVIKNPRDYVKVCEEYAAAGFGEIYKIISETDTEKTPVESILFNIINDQHRNRN